MLSRIKKDEYEPLVLNYYEKVNGKLTGKEIPSKYDTKDFLKTCRKN